MMIFHSFGLPWQFVSNTIWNLFGWIGTREGFQLEIFRRKSHFRNVIFPIEQGMPEWRIKCEKSMQRWHFIGITAGFLFCPMCYHGHLTVYFIRIKCIFEIIRYDLIWSIYKMGIRRHQYTCTVYYITQINLIKSWCLSPCAVTEWMTVKRALVYRHHQNLLWFVYLHAIFRQFMTFEITLCDHIVFSPQKQSTNETNSFVYGFAVGFSRLWCVICWYKSKWSPEKCPTQTTNQHNLCFMYLPTD